MDLLSAGVRELHALLTPPAISPLFRVGGALSFLNEDLTLFAAVFAYLLLIDFLVLPLVLRNPTGSRWFALHAAGNLIVSMFSFSDVVRSFLAPVDALVGPCGSMVPLAAISAIHVYHVALFPLSKEDIFHHAQFVGPLVLLGVMFKNDGGASLNMGSFFLCGVPGGLNYAALVLNKEGSIHKLTQKWFDAAINTWMRAPGLTVFGFMQWQVWLAGVRPTRGWPQWLITLATAAVAGLHVFNGNYYAEQSIGNYHEHLEREREKGGDASKGGGAKRE
jgi:hypothetical protein